MTYQLNINLKPGDPVQFAFSSTDRRPVRVTNHRFDWR